MKKKFRSLIAILLCSAMVSGCAADKPTFSTPLSSEAEYISGESSDGEASSSVYTTAAENTTAVTTTTIGTSSQTENPTMSASTEKEYITSENLPEEVIPEEKPEQTTKTVQQATSQSTAHAIEEPQEAADFSITWKLNSTWEEGGKQCGGYEVEITNNSSKAVGSWTVSVSVPDGFEITASWNGIFSQSGKNLTIKNESYNGEISPGGKSSFGFNYACSSNFSPSGATVNGSAAASQSSDSSNTQTETTTAASTIQTVPPAPDDPTGTTPVAAHGQLSVKGTQLVDKNGNGYQLRGMSTHGITWFPDFINESSFRTLRDDWNTNVVRMAMYVDEWGNGQCYMKNKDGSRQLLEKGVDLCIKLGMYVIIDWHVLNPGDPTAYTNEAIEFFEYVSKKYADYPNIIYEIVNEPNGNADWSGCIKPYAETIIPVIRKNDKDAVIIVGTPTWSQDIDKALADPLDFDNVMYALHFYAATHTDWLRERTEKCISSGLPVFVSEFGCCDASGNGSNDFTQTEKWLKLLDKYGVSYCNWNLANKNEASSSFRESAKADGNWSDNDYSESGAWIRNWFRNH